MTFRRAALTRRGFVVASLAAFSFFGFGCSDSATLSARFAPSATPAAPRLIKLVPSTSSGPRIWVQAVIYGPDTSLDLYTFAFDVKIGDPSVLEFVPESAVAGNALTAFAGQTVTTIAGLGALPGGGVDKSTVVVGVGKLGGGPGNGLAGNSAIIVSMAFEVLKPGTTTLTLAGNPKVLDSNGAPIASITYDPANGSVTGVSTGGSGY